MYWQYIYNRLSEIFSGQIQTFKLTVLCNAKHIWGFLMGCNKKSKCYPLLIEGKSFLMLIFPYKFLKFLLKLLWKYSNWSRPQTYPCGGGQLFLQRSCRSRDWIDIHKDWIINHKNESYLLWYFNAILFHFIKINLYHSMSLGRPAYLPSWFTAGTCKEIQLEAYEVHEMIIKCNLEFNSSNQTGSLWISKHFCLIYSTELYELLTFVRVQREREGEREQIVYYQLCIVNYWNHSYQCCPTKQLTSVCQYLSAPVNDPHNTAWIKMQYKQSDHRSAYKRQHLSNIRAVKTLI